jgi:hypothetical protein
VESETNAARDYRDGMELDGATSAPDNWRLVILDRDQRRIKSILIEA